MVDITPGADRAKTAEIHSFLAGPESFASFDEILERTIAFNPTRSESSLRRGILHNAHRREDGNWVWRHQRTRVARADASDDDAPALELAPLWDDLRRVEAPLRLVLGDRSGRRRRRGPVPRGPARRRRGHRARRRPLGATSRWPSPGCSRSS